MKVGWGLTKVGCEIILLTSAVYLIRQEQEYPPALRHIHTDRVSEPGEEMPHVLMSW
jgi:hypothetical protein